MVPLEQVLLFSLDVRQEQEAFVARRLAREVAAALGFNEQTRLRTAAAVSEIIRLLAHAPPPADGPVRSAAHALGFVPLKIEFHFHVAKLETNEFAGAHGPALPALGVSISRATPCSLAHVRNDDALPRAERLLAPCDFMLQEGDGLDGLTCVFMRPLPPEAVVRSIADAAVIRARVAAAVPGAVDPFAELLRQNQDLAAALLEVERHRSDLEQLNAELQDTNRGVLALYSELDEKAISYQRASEVKTRFLSNMTHEFRTPVNSVLSLTRFLLDPSRGALSDEQRQNVHYVRKAMEDLSVLVNDLLDLAKVESGTLAVRPDWFSVADLFGALRGMFRPLLAEASGSVQFTVEEPGGMPQLFTDEGKLAQILRNFVSNALKFTAHGEVRVSASYEPGAAETRSEGAGDRIVFVVRDSGIGIPVEHRASIFDAFSQIEGELQKRCKGTGLGLPLSRKLAAVLGGSVSVESEVGVGSLFRLVLPRVYAVDNGQAQLTPTQTEHTLVPSVKETETIVRAPQASDERPWILIIDDCVLSRYLLRDLLTQEGCTVTEAHNGESGLLALRATGASRPNAVFLDLNMPGGLSGYEVLEQLKADESTCAIPVIIHSSAIPPSREGWLRERTVAIVNKNHSSHAAAGRAVVNALERALGSLLLSPHVKVSPNA